MYTMGPYYILIYQQSFTELCADVNTELRWQKHLDWQQNI